MCLCCRNGCSTHVQLWDPPPILPVSPHIWLSPCLSSHLSSALTGNAAHSDPSDPCHLRCLRCRVWRGVCQWCQCGKRIKRRKPQSIPSPGCKDPDTRQSSAVARPPCLQHSHTIPYHPIPKLSYGLLLQSRIAPGLPTTKPCRRSHW